MSEQAKCSTCGEPLRNAFDALIHAFEHGAQHNDEVSPLGKAVADNVHDNRGSS